MVAGILLLSACHSKPKDAHSSQASDDEVSTQEAKKSEAPAASFSSADYDTLFSAALDHQVDLVQKKIKQGLDLNKTDEAGRTALMLAAFNGHTDIVKMLMASGADCRKLDVNNRSALMFACTGPFLETVKVLIEEGAEVNGMDSHENWTPVMFAASEGQLEVVKYLIEVGADISMVDIDGESSYDFALSRGHTATAEYLKQMAQKQ